jgi:hypothetical protein
MPKYLFLLSVLLTILNHTQALSISNSNSKTILNKTCEISLNHPENGESVSPMFYQDDHIIFMHWEKYISPDSYPITYIFKIWHPIEPNKILIFEDASTNYKHIKVDQLLTNETYQWQVTALNPYGTVCQSSIGTFKLTDPSGNACIYFIKVLDRCNGLISNASIQQKKGYTYKLTIIPEPKNERILTFGPINDTDDPYTLIVSASGYDSIEVDVDRKELQTGYLVLNRKINLQTLIMTLKIISNFIVPPFCLHDMDVNQNLKCDLGDVIQMMKGELSNGL